MKIICGGCDRAFWFIIEIQCTSCNGKIWNMIRVYTTIGNTILLFRHSYLLFGKISFTWNRYGKTKQPNNHNIFCITKDGCVTIMLAVSFREYWYKHLRDFDNLFVLTFFEYSLIVLSDIEFLLFTATNVKFLINQGLYVTRNTKETKSS